MTNPPNTQADEKAKLPEQLLNCLSIDLEIDERSRLTALAAWRPDTGDELHFQGDHARQPESLQRIDRMSQNASFLLGHNIIKFDIPHLMATSPSLELLKLPAVDTLWLNPLAYPKRPYHRLVKHYKDGNLLRSQRNDPLLDSKLAFDALNNQAQQFLAMTPEMLAAYHHLCTGPGRARPGPGIHRLEKDIQTKRTGRRQRHQKSASGQDLSQPPGTGHRPDPTPRLGTSLRNSMDNHRGARLIPGTLGPAPISQGPQYNPAPEGKSLHQRRLPVVHKAARPDSRAQTLVRLRGVPGGTGHARRYLHPAKSGDVGAGPAGPAGNPAHGRGQIPLLPATGTDQVRPDRRPDRGHIPAGSPDGGPGAQHAENTHGLRKHQRHTGAPGADAEPERRPPGPGSHPAHIPRTAQKQECEQQPGNPKGGLMGHRRSPLPVPVGA